jgi:hypothetical protein
VNNRGNTVLSDDMLHSWDIDEGMVRREGRLISEDPLVLPAVGERAHRPDVTTRIHNLLLCGDYLAGDWEVANMECASYNARRAVNALLALAASPEPPASAVTLPRPPEWEPLKRIDEERWRRGLPNLFDTDQLSEDARGLLGARV